MGVPKFKGAVDVLLAPKAEVVPLPLKLVEPEDEPKPKPLDAEVFAPKFIVVGADVAAKFMPLCMELVPKLNPGVDVAIPKDAEVVVGVPNKFDVCF